MSPKCTGSRRNAPASFIAFPFKAIALPGRTSIAAPGERGREQPDC